MSTPVPAAPLTALQLTAGIIEALAGLAINPVFGAGNVSKLAALLGYLAMLVRRGDAAIAQLRIVDAQIKAIVESGQPPSAEDWADWEARHAAAKARLQA